MDAEECKPKNRKRGRPRNEASSHHAVDSHNIIYYDLQSNIKIQCRRLELNLQDMRQRMEAAKQRLAIEREVRFNHRLRKSGHHTKTYISKRLTEV